MMKTDILKELNKIQHVDMMNQIHITEIRDLNVTDLAIRITDIIIIDLGVVTVILHIIIMKLLINQIW